MEEIWKVWGKTSRSLWEVSDQGRVKRNGELYECKTPLKKGYYTFAGVCVHKAVAILFIPNPENKPCIDHINGNKLDNRACNLRWVSYKENNNNPITKRRQIKSKKNWYKEHPEFNKGENNPMYGKSQSEESKRKTSVSMKIYWQMKKNL